MKVLFIGLGSIGLKHYQSLKKLEDKYKIEFISYRSSKNATPVEGITDYSVLEEALEQKPLFAIISNPTSLHIETAIKCAEHNTNLFIEKPLSNSLEGVNTLLGEVRKRNLITLMGCNLRFHPVLKSLKEILQSNDLGPVYDFSIACWSYLPSWRPDRDYRTNYSAKKEMGGGVVFDLIHEIDYAYWLFGEFEEIIGVKGKLGDLEIETEDCAKAIVITKAGVLGTISLNYLRKAPKRNIIVNCKEGSIEADLVNNRITIDTSEKTTIKEYCVDKFETYYMQMEYFIQSLINKETTMNDVFTGAKILEYALSFKEMDEYKNG